MIVCAVIDMPTDIDTTMYPHDWCLKQHITQIIVVLTMRKFKIKTSFVLTTTLGFSSASTTMAVSTQFWQTSFTLIGISTIGMSYYSTLTRIVKVNERMSWKKLRESKKEFLRVCKRRNKINLNFYTSLCNNFAFQIRYTIKLH